MKRCENSAIPGLSVFFSVFSLCFFWDWGAVLQAISMKVVGLTRCLEALGSVWLGGFPPREVLFSKKKTIERVGAALIATLFSNLIRERHILGVRL